MSDEEERDSHGRTIEDYLADEADRKRKILKEHEVEQREITDAYERGKAEREALYERDKRLFGGS
jgi:hypothetical protein